MSNWQEDQAMERVMRFAGKTRREVRNPCLSANDTIALANRIARERADAQAEIARLRGALEAEYRRGYERRDAEVRGALL